MPCPYFHPLGQLAWPNAPRLPLGDAYAGRCESDPGLPADPDPVTLRDCCNLGYARGKCARFPDAAGPDAAAPQVERKEASQVGRGRQRCRARISNGVLPQNEVGKASQGG